MAEEQNKTEALATVQVPADELVKLAPAAQRVVNVVNTVAAITSDVRRVDALVSARELASAAVGYVDGNADLREFVRIVNALAKCRPQEPAKAE